MSEKKYWQSFGELNQTEQFTEASKKEFKEELLPIEELDGTGLLDAKTPRRDFLKYLGFSTAAAVAAASCEMPVRKAVPFLQRPDDIIPGVPNYYASTYMNGGDAIPVVVKQREGRPIKIEGNELSKLTMGGTTAQCQASVLDLYDPTRLRHPKQKSGNDFKEVPSFEQMDRMIGDAMKGLGGKPVVLLTSTIHSPSTLAVIQQFLGKNPGSRHVQYDAMSCSGMLMANEASYGKRALPMYRFDKAKTIVSLGADFLGTWVAPAIFSRHYSEGKKVKGEKPELSRHIQFESMMSMTGSNADDRFMHLPSETGAVALALLAKLGGGGSSSIKDAVLAKGIDMAAAELSAARGSGLVVCGSNDANVQMIVNAINDRIGANGSTIDWSSTINMRKGVDADMARLAADMQSGAVGALLVYDCNPVYSYFDGKKFGEALARLPLSVSFNSTLCETSEQCKYIIPSHHWLESWGDAEAVSGYVSLLQPIINPLFKTRPFQTSLLNWSTAAAPIQVNVAPNVSDSTNRMMSIPSDANMEPYEAFVKSFWGGKLGGDDNWNKALQDGVIEPGESMLPTLGGGAPAFSAASLSSSASALSAAKSGKYEVVFYEKISVGNGAQANNPWLQELPDPITKVTWDNYAMISPAMAKEFFGFDVMNPNQKDADKYEVEPEKPVLKITVNGRSVSLPSLIVPGMHPQTVAIAVGYGRSSANKDRALNLDRIGRAAFGAGQNVYPLMQFNGASMSVSAPATLEKTGTTYPVAQTQVHGFTEGRPVIYETSLAAYRANPEEVLEEPRHERSILIPHGKEDFRRDATIYPDYAKPGIKWGMSIDLNTCTGCSACVVACTAENNVSVVGKMQVQRAHDMHWLRIDRYFTGDVNNPDVIFQPMLCQHCDNAPCENVCPVAATNHSTEGLNQMTYNRCIGTRYCANNCPYKVRRFNWLDYNGSDSFPDNQNPLIGVDLDEVTAHVNDDLARMVLNPDVTVRGRGVIEKCSFCVQRLQDAKLEAKKQQDPSMVRNVKVACAQACPSDCITFGNVNDPESEVSKIRDREQTNRTFYVLEQLHVLPNVSYLAKVKNTAREVTNHHAGAEKKGMVSAEAEHG